MAAPKRTNVGTVNAAGDSLPASSELRPWRGELADSVMEADLKEWIAKQEHKSPEARKAKAVEIEADLRKYQERLNALAPGDPEFDKLMTKVRRLQLQNDYMDESVRIEATRIRISDEAVGASAQAAAAPRMDHSPPERSIASAPATKVRSSLCEILDFRQCIESSRSEL